MMSSDSTNNNYEGWIARSFHSDSMHQGTTSNGCTAPKTKTQLNNNHNHKIPKTRLILHLDINETILLGDDAGGDSTSDSIQKLLAKSAFCQIPSTAGKDWDSTQELEPTHWWDGQEIGQETSMPPLYTGWEWPPNTCPYYRTKFQKYSKQFVAPTAKETQNPHHGKIYKPIWDECQKLLSIVEGDSTTSSAAIQASRKRHPSLLPAFYHILDYLQELHGEQDTPTLVFRTFGSDIEKVAQWVSEYAKGQHCPWLELGPDKLFKGKWKELEDDTANPGNAIYQLWDLAETKLAAENEEAIVKLLNSGTIFGIVDDYDYWAKSKWMPTAGKPVWIPRSTATDGKEDSLVCHHLLFDDNIHNLPGDGIACIRQQDEAESRFTTVDAAIMHGEEYQGIHLKRVPTIEPVLNPKWYIEQIERSRVMLQEKLTKTSQ